MLNELSLTFVGGGAMGEALVRGLLACGKIEAQNTVVCDISEEKLQILQKKYSVQTESNLSLSIKHADLIVLCVKPQVVQAVLDQLKNHVTKQQRIFSIVAGLTLKQLEAAFPNNPIIRIMPNTPLAVGEGMSAVALGSLAGADEKNLALELFSSVGKAVLTEESALDAITGLSGSGPGYAFVMIDALADAGVRVGLPRQMAITLAAQTLLGSAKMVLETGDHPAILRDMVTSPGGTTIAGVAALERLGLRSALIEAVEAATLRSKELGKS